MGVGLETEVASCRPFSLACSRKQLWPSRVHTSRTMRYSSYDTTHEIATRWYDRVFNFKILPR